MSSSAHLDNKKKGILVFGKGPTRGLEYTLTGEKIYSNNFTMTKRDFAQACMKKIEKIATYLLMVKKL